MPWALHVPVAFAGRPFEGQVLLLLSSACWDARRLWDPPAMSAQYPLIVGEERGMEVFS